MGRKTKEWIRSKIFSQKVEIYLYHRKLPSLQRMQYKQIRSMGYGYAVKS